MDWGLKYCTLSFLKDKTKSVVTKTRQKSSSYTKEWLPPLSQGGPDRWDVEPRSKQGVVTPDTSVTGERERGWVERVDVGSNNVWYTVCVPTCKFYLTFLCVRQGRESLQCRMAQCRMTQYLGCSYIKIWDYLRYFLFIYPQTKSYPLPSPQ